MLNHKNGKFVECTNQVLAVKVHMGEVHSFKKRENNRLFGGGSFFVFFCFFKISTNQKAAL